jgi:polysaccharide biosynthesis/export protein
MRGDSSNDIKLLPGDVVFIPPVGLTVSLDGEVLRPAIYEVKNGGTVADLIQMGGGLTPNADRERAALVRVDAQQRRVVLNVDPLALTVEPLRNGDVLNIARLRPQLDSGVTVQGYVYRPKYFAWHEGVRLSEVIPTVDELKPGADQHYLLIRRELPPNRHIVVLSADLAAALHSPASSADVALMPRDTITVFDLQTSRQYVIQPIMDELRLQSNLAQPTEIVHVDGQVKVPGDYPLEPGMRVDDLIRAGGSLGPTAYAARAELSRFTVVNGEQRQTQVLAIDLSAVRSGDPNANLLLEPFDRLSVKQISEWTEQSQVTLSGEVRFPGVYTIKPGETMHSVLDRAGGLTKYAFPQGSVFIRAELRRQEQDELDRYAQRMKLDISESALLAARGAQGNAGAAASIGESLLSQLQSAKAVGRLVINLPAIIRTRPGSMVDVVLRNGDELVVPKQRQDVIVIGEVQDPTSHLYLRSMSRDDYIDQSGGLTSQADKHHIYVVRADGSVVTGNRGWFRGGDSVEIRPGDAIVVPLDTERLPGLVVWEAVSSILYNLSIAAIALHSF